MSDKPDKAEKPDKPAKSASGIMGLLLPAALAGAAAFGGARIAVARVMRHSQGAAAHNAQAPGTHAPGPPGPTLNLEPFLLSKTDREGHAHAMRLTLAIEFERDANEGGARIYIPRIRDAVLSHLRALPFDEMIDATHADEVRHRLLERLRATGVSGASRVLITDLVVQ